MSYKADITIIGSGCVGLAVARLLAPKTRTLILLERNYSFGMETSSRNSEVIHAGIYYPPNSLKSKLCVHGNELLYRYLSEKNINHKKTGKLVCAANAGEENTLYALYDNAKICGVKGLEILNRFNVKSLEPEVEALCAMISPSTGIMDSHSLMNAMLHEAKDSGAVVSFNSEAVKIEKVTDGYLVLIAGDDQPIETKIVINAAGLGSDKIAALAGIDIVKERLKIYYCKGDYFRSRKKTGFRMLVYPVPGHHGLGIHITPDLAQDTRFGPDTKYVNTLNYQVDEGSKDAFYESIKKIYPDADKESLYPDTCGIRPKLEGPNDSFRDFYISEESARGLKNFINLIGIDSPGLTSCLAIAEHVVSLIS